MSPPQSVWDEIYTAGEYRKHWHYSHPSQELATLVASGIVRRGVSLDIGCGAGTEAIFLASSGFRSYGLDISAEAIRLARTAAEKASVKVDLRVGSALQMPYPNAKFTFLNDRGCLHNLDLEYWKDYASEVARVAKPGTFLLLRGADFRESAEQFTRLSEKRLAKFFSKNFIIGPPQHYLMVSDAGTLKSMVTVLRRRANSSSS